MINNWHEYGSERLLSRNRLLFQRHRLFTKYFLDYFSLLSTESKCLDIGCGDGFFMELLRMLGFNKITGVDPSLPFVNRAREKGLDVSLGNVYQLNGCREEYEVVLLLDVLEHLEEPLTALGIVHTLLRKNGVLFLNVPVCDSLASIMQRLLHQKTKLQQMQEWDPTHLAAFSGKTLEQLCLEAGFSVEQRVHLSNLFPFIGRISHRLEDFLLSITLGGRYGDFCTLVCRK